MLSLKLYIYTFLERERSREVVVRMATGAAGDGLLRGIFEGCISGADSVIQRRPYHRNCGCEMHKSRGHCSHTSRYTNVSYPIRRAWSDGCLAVMAAPAPAKSSGHPSPCSSPAARTAAADVGKNQTMFTLSNED
ncbi:unnamed protein product [Camellia sinensis]